MAFLEKVQRGKIKKPILAILYGPDGVGKTTFGASAPKPLFIGAEEGTNHLDVARFHPNKYEDVRGIITELCNTTHDYKTFVVDTLDWLEPMLWKYICERENVTGIEKIGGGYGQGWVAAQQEWRDFTKSLDCLRAVGLNVLLLAHSQIKVFQDPQTQSTYDRFQLMLHEKSAAVLRQYVESVLFATFKVFTKKENVRDKKSQAFGQGVRVIYTERRPAFDAKNRIGLPLEMALDWNDFYGAVEVGEPESPKNILGYIGQLLEGVKDDALKEKVIKATEKAGSDASELQKILNRLRSILEE